MLYSQTSNKMGVVELRNMGVVQTFAYNVIYSPPILHHLTRLHNDCA